MARCAQLAVLVVAAALAGCGGDGRPGSATGREGATRSSDVRLVRPPEEVVRRCAALAPRRAIPVLCPTRLPRADWYVRYQTLRGGRSEYLTNLDTKPAGSGDPFHVLAGGRRGRFSLKVIRGSWPLNADLPRGLGLVGAKPLKPGQRHDEQRAVRLKVLRSVKVAGHPGLLLKVADYPDGGVHGGHMAVVWNQGRDGYVLSLHFAERSLRKRTEQDAVLLGAVTAMSHFSTDDVR